MSGTEEVGIAFESTTFKVIIPRATIKGIVTGTTVELVVASTSVEDIVPFVTS